MGVAMKALHVRDETAEAWTAKRGSADEQRTSIAIPIQRSEHEDAFDWPWLGSRDAPQISCGFCVEPRCRAKGDSVDLPVDSGTLEY